MKFDVYLDRLAFVTFVACLVPLVYIGDVRGCGSHEMPSGTGPIYTGGGVGAHPMGTVWCRARCRLEVEAWGVHSDVTVLTLDECRTSDGGVPECEVVEVTSSRAPLPDGGAPW